MTDLIPPPPDYPPAIGPEPADPEPAAEEGPSWWSASAPAEDERPVHPAAPRLPEWWKPKPVLTAPADEPETDEQQLAEKLEHPVEPISEQDETAEAVREPRWFISATDYYPTVHLPSPPAALSPRTRAGLYNVAAAGAGWALGLKPALTDAITSCGEQTGISGALVLGGAICLGTAHFWDRRTRHWYRPLAWAARIPLASAVTALALYTPAATI
ncbi:hypothetical protein [Streptomyces mobaraensis]|uniref:Uncharacterized protein n=1 Tax=Streptomyces mobaraensis TaxID=35621 RepID=A0A5N5WCT8_STRMB|nr:hypothetical protein [Streptomyces mobaraensis]KAB7850148.1 hypothetical protein FRZ00_05995 [Streptomyces mobaraensis]